MFHSVYGVAVSYNGVKVRPEISYCQIDFLDLF
jgi:hypothetical protein